MVKRQLDYLGERVLKAIFVMTPVLFPTSMRPIQIDPAAGGSVAIIMRTKDRPILLARAFASVLAQQHKDWHLYLVNDGGERGPVDELVALHAPAFSGRITLIHNDTSMGMEAASNMALSRSTGDFIAVHDDDDAWHPEFLRQCVSYLNDPVNLQFAAVVTNWFIVNERIAGDLVFEESRSNRPAWTSALSMAKMLEYNRFPPISLLTRRIVINAIGPFNDALAVLGDWDYNLRILLLGDIGTIEESLAYYHHRNVSPNLDPYGNSVGPGQTKHTIFGVYYSNSLLRLLLHKEPGFIGVMHVLLRRIGELEDQVHVSRSIFHDQIEKLEARLKERLDAIEVRQNDRLTCLESRLTNHLIAVEAGLRARLDSSDAQSRNRDEKAYWRLRHGWFRRRWRDLRLYLKSIRTQLKDANE